MDDSVLWAVALGVGMFGLMLLTIAGAIAVYWNTIVRKPETEKDTVSDKADSRAGKIAATEKPPPPAHPVPEQPVPVSSPWLWVKAWLFAVLHAATVSLVVGGITLFEDLANASTEIQREGTVSFPKQLLPGTISGSGASRKRFLRPSGEASEAGDVPGIGRLDRPISEEEGWEVVDNPASEARTGGD